MQMLRPKSECLLHEEARGEQGEDEGARRPAPALADNVAVAQLRPILPRRLLQQISSNGRMLKRNRPNLRSRWVVSHRCCTPPGKGTWKRCVLSLTQAWTLIKSAQIRQRR